MVVFFLSEVIVGTFFGIMTKSVLNGLVTFGILFVLNFLHTFLMQIMTISGVIDKLEYNEFWKKKMKYKLPIDK